MIAVALPTATGTIERYRLSEASIELNSIATPADPARVFYSAAHVTADPFANNDPWLDCAVDWDRTLAFRTHLYDLGFGVAEAMDTAQRGMGLGWPQALELIQRSSAHARAYGQGARLACGAGTDHLAQGATRAIDDVIRAYEIQCAAVEQAGARIILMASRALAAVAQGPRDYARVYGHILNQVAEPVIIHWLGDMFDPALAGYWGSDDADVAMATAIEIIEANSAKVEGVKISLLSAEKEIVMRRRLPPGVRMFSGDDFNYPTLIGGDDRGHSDALLGIFAAIAPAAAAALAALSGGDRARFHSILDPTVPLARHIFQTPTRFYKSGIVFMAWLNGHQDHFAMIGGQQSARSLPHFAELFRLADRAGLLTDPVRSAARMARLMALHGIGD